MTYEAQDLSIYGGHPIEIYSFNRESTYWRYTSADEDQTVAGFLYESVAMSRGRIERTSDSARNPLTINVPLDIAFVQQFQANSPSDIITVTVKQFHETDLAKEVVVVWLGRVVNVKFKEKEVELRCEPVYTSIRRPTLRRLYQTTCPHVLYGNPCNANSATFLVAGTIIYISGNTVQATEWSAYPDQYFTGGFVDWQAALGANFDKRFILNHVGNEITMNRPIIGGVAGTTMRAYPGCDHLLETCTDKFSNELNYGGFPYIPQINPLTGASIF